MLTNDDRLNKACDQPLSDVQLHLAKHICTCVSLCEATHQLIFPR